MKIAIDISEEDLRKVRDGRASVAMMRKAILDGIFLKRNEDNIYIPYLMHKEMGTPISECRKAYDAAMEYLRSKSKISG